MKANRFGAFCFGYSYEEYKKICSVTTGITEKSMIKKWGIELGKQKWQEYKNKQAEKINLNINKTNLDGQKKNLMNLINLAQLH